MWYGGNDNWQVNFEIVVVGWKWVERSLSAEKEITCPLAASSRGAVQCGVQCDLWWWWRNSKAINLLVDLHSYSNKSVALGSDWKSNFVDISGGSELPPKGLSFKDRMRSHLEGAQYWAAIVPLHIKGDGRGGLDTWLTCLRAPSTGMAYQEKMWQSQDMLESLHLLMALKCAGVPLLYRLSELEEVVMERKI